MCRLCGFIDVSLVNSEEQLIQMRDSMSKGGPDDSGQYFNKDIGLALGHRRLSIIDTTSNGHQPMYNNNGCNVIVFNGEIYNYIYLKNILLKNGYIFKSNSDTEVILNGFDFWGLKVFELLEGMFAIAIYDQVENKLILARDSSGIKPLYYFFNNEKFYFTSEIKAFKKIDLDQENPDWKIYFLAFGFIPEPYTILKNTFSLDPGSILVYNIENNDFKISKFKEFDYETIKYNNYREFSPILKEAIINSVKDHLISDVPVCFFLSGGIDSSLLTLISKNIYNNKINTISIDFEEEKFSEKYFQKIVVDKVESNHHSFIITEKEFNESLSDILDAMDQPSIDGINTYFICSKAKELGFKVAFSGLGADELFCGYPSFDKIYLLRISKFLPKFLFKIFKKLEFLKINRLSYLSINGPIGDYLFLRGIHTISEISSILKIPEFSVERKLKYLNSYYKIKNMKDVNYISFLEMNLYMKNQLLRDSDFMSMWHSVEIRVPFVNTALIDLVLSVNSRIKYKKNKKKYLITDLFKDLLPIEIIERKKMGFTFPFQKWITKDSSKQNNKLENKNNSDYSSNKNKQWSKIWSSKLINS